MITLFILIPFITCIALGPRCLLPCYPQDDPRRWNASRVDKKYTVYLYLSCALTVIFAVACRAAEGPFSFPLIVASCIIWSIVSAVAIFWAPLKYCAFPIFYLLAPFSFLFIYPMDPAIFGGLAVAIAGVNTLFAHRKFCSGTRVLGCGQKHSLST